MGPSTVAGQPPHDVPLASQPVGVVVIGTTDW